MSNEEQKEIQVPQKLVYSKPTLTNFGAVRNLTASGSGTQNENDPNSTNMECTPQLDRLRC
jgi:hypothetical protein